MEHIQNSFIQSATEAILQITEYSLQVSMLYVYLLKIQINIV